MQESTKQIAGFLFFCASLAFVFFLFGVQIADLEERVNETEARLVTAEKQARDASQHAYELEQQIQQIRTRAQYPSFARPGLEQDLRARVPGQSLEQALRGLDPSTVATLVKLLGLL